MTALIRVRTVWSGVAGTPWYSNHHFADDGTSATAQAAVDAVDAFWEAIAGNISDLVGWEVQGDVPRIDDSDGGLTGSYAVTPASGEGETAGDMLPRSTQGTVRWETGVVHPTTNRRMRGHTYIPGLLETLNDQSGNPSAAWLAILQAAADGLIANAATVLTLYSRAHSTSALVTGSAAPATWAVLRSRRD